MEQEKKTLFGAYGMMLLGIFTGILGIHRFYLQQRFTGTLMSALSLGGVIMVVKEYVQAMSQLLTALTEALSDPAAAGSIPNIEEVLTNPGWLFYAGLVVLAVSGAWWLLDILLLPALVRKYNAGL